MSTALPSPPTDGITALSYLGPTSLLASTSWDGALRLHDTHTKSHVATHAMNSGPLLALATQDAHGMFTGSMDGSVQHYDLSSGSASLLGMHSPQDNATAKVACSCLSVVGPTLVASAGWDSTFHLWDLRQSRQQLRRHRPVTTIALPGKAFDMDACGDTDTDNYKIVVATAARRICFLDIRMPTPYMDTIDYEEYYRDTVKIIMNRESSLKYQTRCIRFFPNRTGIAIGSIEGRVAMEYLDDIGIPSGGKKKYAFKCHRINDTIYPVNTLVFHPQHDTFATGGADGTVITWDGNHKKKIANLAKLPTSISALAFHSKGHQIAMASSYTFEEGERDHPREEIYVRDILESEVMPKGG